MSDSKWWAAKAELAAYRAHIQNLPSDTPRAYTLSKAELDRILSQKEGGLDGIRIYLGAKTVNGVMVPTITIVPTELVNGVQIDYGIPPSITPPAEARSAGVARASKLTASLDGEGEPGGGDEGEEEELDLDVLADPEPCPQMCGPDNALNSEE